MPHKIQAEHLEPELSRVDEKNGRIGEHTPLHGESERFDPTLRVVDRANEAYGLGNKTDITVAD